MTNAPPAPRIPILAARLSRSGLSYQEQPGVDRAEPCPSPLATDSQSARDVSYNPQHHDRMKHVQRRHLQNCRSRELDAARRQWGSA